MTLAPLTLRQNQEDAVTAVLRDMDIVADYLMRKVEVTGACWLWQGKIGSKGYSTGGCLGITDHAHRLVYRLLVGEIPKGMHLDHVCRVRHCVNPDHLEVVTVRENLRRGFGFVGSKLRQTHCHRGHSLNGDNLRLYRGKRECIACMPIKEARRKAITKPCPHCEGQYSTKQMSTHIKRVHEKGTA